MSFIREEEELFVPRASYSSPWFQRGGGGEVGGHMLSIKGYGGSCEEQVAKSGEGRKDRR